MKYSLPPRLLEHWCSTHLTRRYGSKVRMWLPTSDADATIERSRALVSTRFWLEFTSTVWDKKSGSHALRIDLDQLDRYGRQSIPDYYVIPRPAWTGVLGKKASATWLGDLHRSDLAYESHAADRWYARWTSVVSGDRLRYLLGDELARYRRKKKGRTPVVAHTDGAALTRTDGEEGLSELSWHDFWSTMEARSDEGSPAQFVLAEIGNLPETTTRSSLVAALAKRKKTDPSVVEPAAVYSPTGVEAEFGLTPFASSLKVKKFTWGADTSRALISLTPEALDL